MLTNPQTRETGTLGLCIYLIAKTIIMTGRRHPFKDFIPFSRDTCLDMFMIGALSQQGSGIKLNYKT